MQCPVAPDFEPAVFQDEVVAPRQLFDAGKHGLTGVVKPSRQRKIEYPIKIRLFWCIGTRENRLDLGSEDKPFRPVRVVEGFLTEPIPEAKGAAPGYSTGQTPTCR